ncbi:MAG: Na+/H+ antiporter subunit B [Planctomycetota bacterium]
MTSVIYRTAAVVILPVMLLLSIVVLLRGHNEPGGGFVGGLLAASGFALYALSHGHAEALMKMRVKPKLLCCIGLLAATLSGIPALVLGDPYLKSIWFSIQPPGFPEPLKIGTPLVFDIGVYLLVLGAVALMVLTLEEFRHDPSAGD